MPRELHPKLFSQDAAPFLIIPAFLVYFSWLLVFKTDRFLGSSSPLIKAAFLVILAIFLLTFIWRLSQGFVRLEGEEIQYCRPGDKKVIQRFSLKNAEPASIEAIHYRQNVKYNSIHIPFPPSVDPTKEEPRNLPLPLGRHPQDPEVQAFLEVVNQEIKRLNEV